MCRAIDERIDKTRNEALKSIALRMLNAGKNDLAEIAEMTALPLEEVKILSENKTALAMVQTPRRRKQEKNASRPCRPEAFLIPVSQLNLMPSQRVLI